MRAALTAGARQRARWFLAYTWALACGLCQPAAVQAAPDSVVLVAGGGAQKVLSTLGASPLLAAKYDATSARFAPDPALVALGRRLFVEPRLSNPVGASCASCHDPARAFLPSAQALAGGPGTPRGSRPGEFSLRNAPSLLYVRYVPRRHFYQDDDAPYPSPFGGLMADGRADTLAEQARGPLFDRHEMNNGNPRQLLQRLQRNGLARELADSGVPPFGPAVLREPEALVRALGAAFEAYLQSDEMAPFSSRFDAYLRTRQPLAPAEMRGLALFKNPDKGNCASCHALSDTASRPERSLFTDFGYDAIAVPRNRALAANRQPGHFDHGLCATAQALRWPEPEQWCAYLRTPGLRNVALRQSFMHNGVLHSLRDAVAFYNTRSIQPAKWYGPGGLFDDVAPARRGNVNVNSPPMNRRPDQPPALSEQDIDDLVAFLRSLTDAAYVAALPPR
ncbi:cytochrome c peroxidase [Curvibacter sp. HBC28]|uniref:Cytochrome c peroxidase n=1 Tax=Curvibacter microcysteis TaxID=3026419 RepID=A0ABT5M9S9_9BURK|nr:cytochrome c peroxidase [Curvibacter sp. HBC28]MDD0813145.1 cytochrome c peroxidase [Curvibacter sp. HBC28]